MAAGTGGSAVPQGGGGDTGKEARSAWVRQQLLVTWGGR